MTMVLSGDDVVALAYDPIYHTICEWCVISLCPQAGYRGATMHQRYRHRVLGYYPSITQPAIPYRDSTDGSQRIQPRHQTFSIPTYKK